MDKDVELKKDGSVLTVSLNRPLIHNAMTAEMVLGLTAVFQDVNDRDDIRVVVLTGNGRSFCAGADLSFMHAAADYSFDENVSDGGAIFDLMQQWIAVVSRWWGGLTARQLVVAWVW